jgi:hypothetical protein
MPAPDTESQRDPSPPGPNSGSPIDVFNLGLRQAPLASKFVLGALVVFAAAALVGTWSRGLAVIIPAVLAILVVGLLVALLAGAVQKGRLGFLGDGLSYALVFMVIIVLGLFVTSAFFSWPRPGAILLSRWLNAPELLPRAEGRPQPRTVYGDQVFTLLPPEMQLPLAEEGQIDRKLAIQELPDLIIDGGKVTLGGSGENRTLTVARLKLNNGGIVTNGAHLTINANVIESNGGFIDSFLPGVTAKLGDKGANGGRVTLHIGERIRGSLAVALGGQSGADGTKGPPGGAGGAGGQGENASSSLFDCSHGPGAGQPGQRGGNGGDGSAGGAAGNGGSLVIVAEHPDQIASSISFTNPAGIPGNGGPGGERGPGGPGGSSNGHCHGTGPAGGSGPPGDPGKVGPAGAKGIDGPPVILQKAPA